MASGPLAVSSCAAMTARSPLAAAGSRIDMVAPDGRATRCPPRRSLPLLYSYRVKIQESFIADVSAVRCCGVTGHARASRYDSRVIETPDTPTSDSPSDSPAGREAARPPGTRTAATVSAPRPPSWRSAPPASPTSDCCSSPGWRWRPAGRTGRTRRSRTVLWVASVVLAVAFGIQVRRYRRVERRRRHLSGLADLAEEALLRIARDWQQLPLRHEGGADPLHPYAGDLDLLGHGSLLHLLESTGTRLGESTLKGWLLDAGTARAGLHEAAGLETVRQRQAAVQELAPLAEWREELVWRGRATGTPSPDPEPFLAWAEGEPFLASQAGAGLGGQALAAAVLGAAAGADGRADRLAALDRADHREPADRLAAGRHGGEPAEPGAVLRGGARGVRRRAGPPGRAVVRGAGARAAPGGAPGRGARGAGRDPAPARDRAAGAAGHLDGLPADRADDALERPRPEPAGGVAGEGGAEGAGLAGGAGRGRGAGGAGALEARQPDLGAAGARSGARAGSRRRSSGIRCWPATSA